MRIEIWSDIACPWCYIGKTRFEAALAEYEHKDSVEVVWRSYELQAGAPKREPVPTVTHLMAKYGRSQGEVLEMLARVTEEAAKEGLEYHLDKAVSASTFDAHRLIHFAIDRGLGHEAMTRLMQAYQGDGADVSDPETLVRLGVEVGLDGGEIRELLAGDEYGAEVLADERRAQSLGVSGVPFFVIDELHGISGAQPSEYFLSALRQLGPQVKPVVMLDSVGAAAGACTDDACELPQS